MTLENVTLVLNLATIVIGCAVMWVGRDEIRWAWRYLRTNGQWKR